MGMTEDEALAAITYRVGKLFESIEAAHLLYGAGSIVLDPARMAEFETLAIVGMLTGKEKINGDVGLEVLDDGMLRLTFMGWTGDGTGADNG